MKDAFGGILNLVFITLFLVIVSGILAMTVNYTKAFRMKNIVISSIEQYEGYGCFNDTGACYKKIEDGAKSIGYHPVNVHCPNGTNPEYHKAANFFCYARRESTGSKKRFYTIVTQVDIDIPIVRDIMGLSFFQVHGDTRNIKD